MARILARGVSIETEKLARDMRAIAQKTRELGAAYLSESLQAMIDSMRSASPLRATQVNSANLTASSGTVDNPMVGAQVVTDVRRGSLSSRTRALSKIVVYVDHDDGEGNNLFNLLDAGIPARRVGERFVFPRYKGHTTPPRGIVSGDPAHIARSINSANVEILRDKKGRPIMASPKVGKILRRVEGRGFYQAAARYAYERLLKDRIVSADGKYSYKLSRDQVVIKATDRGRFKRVTL